ncbi:MAG: Gfo/Idh/MocA family oxidoreductase [Armatimonadota bacterium]
MAKKLRVGVIGSGAIFTGAHLPGWKALAADCEIVAIADIKETSQKTAIAAIGNPDLKVYDDYQKMFAAEKLDVVDVCTPNCFHCAPTVAAFEAGCHVITEKPCATSVAEVEKMIAAGKKAKKLFMVAQSMRFQPEHMAMKRWVDEGLIGEVYYGRLSLLRPRGVPSWGDFILKEMSAGGPCYDLAVHILDLALYLMGHPEPVAVSANYWLKLSNKPSVMKHDPKRYSVPDELAAGFIRFANGASLILETSWAVNAPEGTYNVFLAGDKGGMQNSPLTLVREEAGMLTNTTVQMNPDAGIASHSEEVRRFVEAIQKKLPSPVPGEQALLTQRILDGIYKSAEKRKEVKV